MHKFGEDKATNSYVNHTGKHPDIVQEVVDTYSRPGVTKIHT